MDFLTTSEAAKQWGITRRRVTVLCSTGRIPGATQVGSMWLIPKGAKKPADGRKVRVRVKGRKEKNKSELNVGRKGN